MKKLPKYKTESAGEVVMYAVFLAVLVLTLLAFCDKNGHATNTSSKYNTSKHYIYAYDVRMYNRTMSASEVQQLYNAIQ